MAFDFPSSPIIGQQFTPIVGGPTYAWNGYAWSIRPALVVPGTLVEIARQTVTAAVASVDFTSGIDATYDEYEIHIIGLKPTSDDVLGLRISQDGGATWKAGASDYYYATSLAYSNTVGSFAGAASTYWPLSGTTIGATASHGLANFIVRFGQPAVATDKKSFFSDGTFTNPTGGQTRISNSATYQPDANAINGVRLFLSGGATIAKGTFVLYGRSKVPANLSGGASVTISDTPPVAPQHGNLWWESDSGKLWISYNDGNSQQWVAVAPSGVPPVGVVVNTAYAETTTMSTTTATMAGALDTIPQQTDGAQVLTCAITPNSATNKLRVLATIPMAVNAAAHIWAALFKDSAAPAIDATLVYSPASGTEQIATLALDVIAATTSPVTFKLRVGSLTGVSQTITINGTSGARVLGGSVRASISVQEIAA